MSMRKSGVIKCIIFCSEWQLLNHVFIFDLQNSYLSYRIYLNKRRATYLIFHATSAALIRGRRLFKHCTRQTNFFYIFVQWYTFYLLIFLWTDTKLIVNLELHEKFTR